MSFDESPNDQVSIRLRILRSTLDVVTKYEKEHDLKTSSHTKAINQIIMEHDKLQKQNETAHSINDVLQMLDKVSEKLSSLEKSITAQIEQQQCCKKIYKVQIQARGKKSCHLK